MTNLENISASMLTASFSKEIYCSEAILAAAYRLTEKYGVDIQANNNDYVAMLVPRSGYSPDEATINEELKLFKNDALDEELRHRLYLKTGKLQELIVRHAFAPIDLRKEVANG
jgi:His-Xaa-Ser system protein HxsD